MNKDLGTLRVTKLIVHDVPVRQAGGGSTATPQLSEVESTLTPDLRTYFRDRLVHTLKGAYDVSFDPASTSPVPESVFGLLKGQRDSFVSVSQSMADHLFAVQTAVNPAGLLTVIQGTIERERCICIVKLEREEGVRIHLEEVDGQRTFSVELLRELMLTEKTRIFKASVFHQPGEAKEDIRGAVSDNQRPYASTTEVADFFLKKFLGCRLLDAPEIVTKRFFVETEAFINEDVDEPERKARYQIGLLATMASEERAIRPSTFASQHLTTTDRQQYLRRLGEGGVSDTQFDKDLSLIKSQIARVQMDFESGIAVLGSPAALESHAQITTSDSGATRIEIEDVLKGVRGRK